MALAPAAAANVQDPGALGAMLDVEAVALPVPGTALPNPATIAIDAADTAGLALGAHDAQGFALAAAPWFAVLWYPGLVDEQGLHPSWALAFQEDTTNGAAVVLDTAQNVYGSAATLAGIAHGEKRAYSLQRLPHMTLALDAADLKLGASLEVPQAQADGAAGRTPVLQGRAGAALNEGVAGHAGASGAGALLALPSGEGLGRTAAFGSAAPPVAAPAAVAAASAGPMPLAGSDAVLAAGLVATGLLLGGLALYHLVNRNNIFENDVRMQVYDVVARNPGVTIQEVARAVSLSHPTARYHLNVLAKNDLVVFLDKGNKMMFFRNRNEFSEQEREVVAILRNVEATRVYDSIEASPWILRKELSERLGISRTSVNWHLRNLMRAGLVAETREQGKGFLFVRREGREILLRVLPRVVREPVAQALPVPKAAAPAVGEARGQPA